jgi:predicted N-acyltransferase
MRQSASIQEEGPDIPYLNLLEPYSLVRAFLDYPPKLFSVTDVCRPVAVVPGFCTPFDLLTTLDETAKQILTSIPFFHGRFLKPETLFVGTTVSEYLLYPPSINPARLVADLLEDLEHRKLQLLILKDIPLKSPLLSDHENTVAAQLVDHCKDAGLQILAGQALAYVPIEFVSIDEYMRSLSYSRRKNLRRKLRSRRWVDVEEIPTGDPIFSKESFLRELFNLYLNVYQQSRIHFDRLTLPFFRCLLQEPSHNGTVFIYRRQKKIIGYNVCFIYNHNLVDKYVGFLYPDAREVNLYFLSWFYNLEYALKHRLKFYIAGWTDPEIKAFLGAQFTMTLHAVYLKNPLLRGLLKKLKRFFEPDQKWYGASGSALLDREYPI